MFVDFMDVAGTPNKGKAAPPTAYARLLDSISRSGAATGSGLGGGALGLVSGFAHPGNRSQARSQMSCTRKDRVRLDWFVFASRPSVDGVAAYCHDAG